MMTKFNCEIILYVADQQKSRDFYSTVLQLEPTLDVPGMTEFNLSAELKLGLMPESGIAKIISPVMPHPSSGKGISRCELYLLTDEIELLFERAIQNGAKKISEIQNRDWGHKVGYVADLDGHILAFAKEK